MKTVAITEIKTLSALAAKITDEAIRKAAQVLDGRANTNTFIVNHDDFSFTGYIIVPQNDKHPHTCDNAECKVSQAVALANIMMADEQYFQIGIEQSDIDALADFEETPAEQAHESVVAAMLNWFMGAGIKVYLTEHVVPRVNAAIVNQKFEVLEDISEGTVFGDCGEHFVNVVSYGADGTVDYKIEIDDPKGLFFNANANPDQYLFSNFMGAIHNHVTNGLIMTDIDLPVGSPEQPFYAPELDALDLPKEVH